MQSFAWGDMIVLFRDQVVLVSLLGGLSLVMLIGSLIAVPLVVVRLPQDYLIRESRIARIWPWHISFALLILKNALGAILLLSGLAMLILPGQGLLTMFIGLVLIDFPGKHILIRRILGQRHILRMINRLRARFGSFDLESPPETATGDRAGFSSLETRDPGGEAGSFKPNCRGSKASRK